MVTSPSTGVRPGKTEAERRAGVSPEQVFRRAVAAVLWVTNPLLVAVAVLVGIGLPRQRRVPPKVYLPIGIVIGVGALLLGWAAAYVRAGLAAWIRVREAATAGGMNRWQQAVLNELPAALVDMLAAQAPMILAGGVAAGTVIGARRYRLRARWKDPHEVDTEVRLTEQQTQRALARADKHSAAKSGKRVSGAWEELHIPLGVSLTTGRPCWVTPGEVSSHVYIDGPTGFGKTFTIMALAQGHLSLPSVDPKCPAGMIFVTMKPDPKTTAMIEAMAAATGRNCVRVTEDGEGGQPFNPIAAGSAQQVATGIVAVEAKSPGGGFTEPHHRKAAERLLRITVSAIDELAAKYPDKWRRDYPTIAQLLHLDALREQADVYGPELSKVWTAYEAELQGPDAKDLGKSIAGLRQRIALAAEGGAHAVLADSPRSIQLQDWIERGDVVIMDLDADTDEAAAQLIGSLALQDVRQSLGRLSKRNWNRTPDGEVYRSCLIVVDEFSSLGGQLVGSLFRTLRSRGGSLVLASQEMGALEVDSPILLETVQQNCNVMMLHNQGPRAEEIAKLIGTKTDLEATEQFFSEGGLANQTVLSGQGSVKRVERFIVHPNTLRRLGKGQAVVRIKTRTDEPPQTIKVRAVSVQQPPEAAAPPAEDAAKVNPWESVTPIESDPDILTPTRQSGRDVNRHQNDQATGPKKSRRAGGRASLAAPARRPVPPAPAAEWQPAPAVRDAGDTPHTDADEHRFVGADGETGHREESVDEWLWD